MAASAETVRDHLAGALMDLKEYDLKKFKYHLNRLPAEGGYASIPKGRLQMADGLDLCRLLFGYYAEDGAMEVTLKVLGSINRRDLREKLLQVKGGGGGGGLLGGCFGQGQWQGKNRNIGRRLLPPFERDVASLRSLRDPSFSLRLFTSFDSCGMGDFRFASTRTETVGGRSVTRRRMVENGQERVDVEVDPSNALAINVLSATIGEREAVASCRNLKKKVTEVLDVELSHLVELKENMAGMVSSGRNTRRSTEAKNTHIHLLEALENLTEYNLRTFKAYLNRLPVKEGYSNIPRGRLEEADRIDMAQLLLGYYNEHYAVEVTTAVLKFINQRDLERNLLEITENNGRLDGWFSQGQWQCGNRRRDGSGSLVASCRFPSFGRDFSSLCYLRQGGLISFSLSLSASFDALGAADFKCISTSTEMVSGRKQIRKRVIENEQETEEIEDIEELKPLAITGSPVIMRFPEAAANFQNVINELSHELAGDVSAIEEEDLGGEVPSGGVAERSALCVSQNGETLPGTHAPLKRTPGLEMFHDWIPQHCLENLQHIGRGGFGTVFRADHKEKGAVALKIFNRTNAPSTNVSFIRQQALNEARFMDEASFAPIPRLYGLYEKGNEVGLVMEYVENGNLSGLLSSALPWPLRIRILYQVALGIDFLHCLHPPRFHLDLKPSNILLDEALNVKVADFGLSKFGTTQRSPLTSESAEVSGGTLEYMPPEAFADSYKPDPATDVYSYGILMFSVLTGKEPYPSNPQRDISIFRMQIQENQRPNTQELEGKIHEVEKLENLISLMKRCWQKEKAQRPSFKVCSQEIEEIYSCYLPHIEAAVSEVQDNLAKAKLRPLKVAQDQAGHQSKRKRTWSEVDHAMPKEMKEDSERGASSRTATMGSICLESLPSGEKLSEKPADCIKKSKKKLTKDFALQKNREAFLNVAEEDGLLTKGECLCLSQMNDAQEFVESMVNTVLEKKEFIHDLFLYCMEKLRL